MSENLKDYNLSFEEKAKLLTGFGNMQTYPIKDKGIESLNFADGPHGIRADKESTIPDISRQHYGWPGTEFMAVEAVAIAFFAGMLKSKIKWFFPVFGFIYMAVIYLEGSSIGAMLSLYFCAMIALEMLVSITAVTVLKWLIGKLKQL